MLSFNRTFPLGSQHQKRFQSHQIHPSLPKMGKARIPHHWGDFGVPRSPCSPHPITGSHILAVAAPRLIPLEGLVLEEDKPQGGGRKRISTACVCVPAWRNSPDLFADKGFIFLSQRCRCKTNRVKPLKLLPARTRCWRTPAPQKALPGSGIPGGSAPKWASQKLLLQVLCPSQGHGKSGTGR